MKKAKLILETRLELLLLARDSNKMPKVNIELIPSEIYLCRAAIDELNQYEKIIKRLIKYTRPLRRSSG